MAIELFAVVEDGKVTNMVLWDPGQHPAWLYDGPGELVPATAEARIGCGWDGNAFVAAKPLPEPSLDELKQASLNRIDQAFRYFTGGVMIDNTKREELRLLALATVSKVTAATDAAAVMEVETQGIAAMQAATPKIGA